MEIWQEVGHDGKPRYVKMTGNLVYLSKDKSGALDDIPDGWKVIRRKNNVLRLVKE
jgi:hypothetical protein